MSINGDVDVDEDPGGDEGEDSGRDEDERSGGDEDERSGRDEGEGSGADEDERSGRDEDAGGDEDTGLYTFIKKASETSNAVSGIDEQCGSARDYGPLTSDVDLSVKRH